MKTATEPLRRVPYIYLCKILLGLFFLSNIRENRLLGAASYTVASGNISCYRTAPAWTRRRRSAMARAPDCLASHACVPVSNPLFSCGVLRETQVLHTTRHVKVETRGSTLISRRAPRCALLTPAWARILIQVTIYRRLLIGWHMLFIIDLWSFYFITFHCFSSSSSTVGFAHTFVKPLDRICTWYIGKGKTISRRKDPEFTEKSQAFHTRELRVYHSRTYHKLGSAIYKSNLAVAWRAKTGEESGNSIYNYHQGGAKCVNKH